MAGMRHSAETRKTLEELERRKGIMDDPCEFCDGTGGHENRVCSDCLGQGVLLTTQEYRTVLFVSGLISEFDDSILNEQRFNYES